jgi:hypothetical protein
MSSARWLLKSLLVALVVYAAASLIAGWFLPGLLFHPPLPSRTDQDRGAILEALRPEGAFWTQSDIPGGGGVPLRVHWLHRPRAKGVALLLHGFGDDAFGTAPLLRDLPDWDAVVFTFRGRDLHPEVPATLGAWERKDVVAVVHVLEASRISRDRILLVGASQGAGTALLALAMLERQGAPLAGALLESPFRDLREAARNHVKGTLGRGEIWARPAERIALWRAGWLAGFDPDDVSPLRASRGLKTPLALLTGDADGITPLAGVRAIAGSGLDLTVVPGAGHLEAGLRVPGGWKTWADARLLRWGL